MKRFEVYSHPTLGLVAVKNGWSWPGFFFSWIWLALCRMWLWCLAAAAAPWVGVVALAVIIGTALPEESNPFAAMDDTESEEALFGLVWVCMLVVSLIVGAKGNRWRRGRLAKRGFMHLTSVQAPSADAAVAEASAGEKAEQASAA